MFTPQLAAIYNPAKNYGVSEWYSSPKLDGIRGCFVNGKIKSRTLKLNYLGLEHIESVCNQFAGNYVIDGELYIPDERFDIISGIVRKTKKYTVAEKQRVQFHVFGLWSEAGFPGGTAEMVDLIQQLVPPFQPSVIAVPYTKISSNPLDVQTQRETIRSAGLSEEGIMLRNPVNAYSLGRSQNLLKVKNVANTIFTITGFHKGSGKYSKSLGKLSISGVVNGITVSAKVGTGFTDAQRQEIWNNQSDYLNTGVEIIYMGVTDAGSLRQPVFSRFSWVN